MQKYEKITSTGSVQNSPEICKNVFQKVWHFFIGGISTKLFLLNKVDYCSKNSFLMLAVSDLDGW